VTISVKGDKEKQNRSNTTVFPSLREELGGAQLGPALQPIGPMDPYVHLWFIHTDRKRQSPTFR